MKKILLIASSLFLTLNAFSMPNPSSDYCEQVGGTNLRYEFNDTSNNFYLCKIGQSELEEWSLFRFCDNGTKSDALDIFFKHPTPPKGVSDNAAAFCSRATGANVVVVRNGNKQKSFCKFYDGSVMDIETLYAGPQGARNNEFSNILKCKIKYKMRNGGGPLPSAPAAYGAGK